MLNLTKYNVCKQSTSMNGKKNGFFLSSTLFLLLRYIPVNVFVVCVRVWMWMFRSFLLSKATHKCLLHRTNDTKKKKEKAEEEKSMQRGRNNRDRNHT